MAWGAQIRGTEGLAGELLAAIQEGTKNGLNALGIKGAEMVHDNIASPFGSLPPAVAFGDLLASVVFKYEREATMCREVIGIGPTLKAFEYAAPVETGARPHMPPASLLVAWVQKKFGIEDGKQALSVAFAVAKSIAKRGTQGHQMYSRALEALEPLAPAELNAAIEAAMIAHGFKGATA